MMEAARAFRWLFTLLLGLLALHALAAPASGNDLPSAVDLHLEADLAKKTASPLIVIFSRPDCKYCEAVKRDYLKPLISDPRYRGVVIRQVDQDSAAPLIDFRGKLTTQARFASAEKVKLVPVVAFYGPDGKRLVEPIVGARLADFYQTYLEDSIEKSTAALKAR